MQSLGRSFIQLNRPTILSLRNQLPRSRKHSLSTFAQTVSNPAAKVQAYISRSNDPYLNLSIEHYLLQKSPSDSVILFLYANRPCIVIGRNQNPWSEVNLGLLNGQLQSTNGLGKIDLVRRRSGGGTVFHDEGNINWSVICPSPKFTRDKHAEMVVRALRKLGIERSRVNKRHDIVLDQGSRKYEPATTDDNARADDTHRTPFEIEGLDAPTALKVSGSAYKMTRGRSLHHGTCLLSSPNLPVIPMYLHSPAKPFISARGVESVSSPVGNIGIDRDAFIKSVSSEFFATYGQVKTLEVGEEQSKEEDIQQGMAEIMSMDWILGQTPLFTFSSNPEKLETKTDQMPVTTSGLPSKAHISFTARRGIVSTGDFALSDVDQDASIQKQSFNQSIKDRRLYNDLNWSDVVESVAKQASDEDRHKTIAWIETMFPRTTSSFG